MIESRCLCCGAVRILPDPPGRTPMERIQFEKDWDARYELRKSLRQDLNRSASTSTSQS